MIWKYSQTGSWTRMFETFLTPRRGCQWSRAKYQYLLLNLLTIKIRSSVKGTQSIEVMFSIKIYFSHRNHQNVCVMITCGTRPKYWNSGWQTLSSEENLKKISSEAAQQCSVSQILFIYRRSLCSLQGN